MSARMHAAILFLMIIGITIGVIFWPVRIREAMTYLPLGIAAALGMWLAFLFRVPARCTEPGCSGRMSPKQIQDGLAYRLQYACDQCGHAYDTRIGIGLGTPGDW